MKVTKQSVHDTLKGIGAAAVCYFYPKDHGQLPAISYFERERDGAVYADDRLYLGDVCYQVDIWAAQPQEMHELAHAADVALDRLGLVHRKATETFEKGIYRKSIEFV